MRDFRKLKIWQRAHQLTLGIYRATAGFPKREIYGLTSQIRRASASIPANIAEGSGRHGDTEFARFLQIAAGSASELQYHLILAKDLGYLSAERFGELSAELEQLKRMLTIFIQRVRARIG